MIGALNKIHENPLSYLYRFITKNCFEYSKKPFIRAFQLLLIIQVPVIIFGTIVDIVFNHRIGSTMENSMGMLIIITVIAPALETLMIALAYGICNSFSLSERRMLGINAIFFASLHCFVDPVRFFPSLWAFLFFCTAYQIGNKQSFYKGFFLSFALHVLCNSLAVALFLCTIK